jgi:NADH dehydrogenase/NADH:ubiquinone oxidoreductase subunit G
LLSKDRNPNTNGARLILGSRSAPGAKIMAIADAVRSGEVKALLILKENAMHLGLSVEELARLPALIVMNNLQNAVTEKASVVLPACGFAEKRGSMINGKGRLQRLNRATRPPGNARDDWEILRDLLQAIGGGNSLHSIEEVFRRMSETVPQFAGLSLSQSCRRRIPATKKQSNKPSRSRLHVAVSGTSWIMRKLISLHRRSNKSNHKGRPSGKIHDRNGLFLHHHVATEDRNSAGRDFVHGVLHCVRGTPGQRVYSRPRGAESGRAGRSFPANRRYV